MTNPIANGTSHLPACVRQAGIGAAWPERALSEPRFDHKRIGEAADADDADDRKQQGPPCRQDEVIADVGNGLKADKGQKQAESEQRGDRRVL